MTDGCTDPGEPNQLSTTLKLWAATVGSEADLNKNSADSTLDSYQSIKAVPEGGLMPHPRLLNSNT
jgi:hypothetical protein